MQVFFKKKPLILKNQKSLIEQYYAIKKKLEIHLKIKLFLQMLENNIDQKSQKKKIPKQMTEIYKHFCKCFSKLANNQKSYFLLAIIKLVSFLLVKSQSDPYKFVCEYENKIEKIQCRCQIKEFFMGVAYWENKIFKFFNQEKVVKITSHSNNPKTQIIFFLNQYLIRASSKQKHILVFQAIFDIWKLPQKLHIFYVYFHDQILFNQIYNTVRNAIITTWKSRLGSMLNQNQKINLDNLSNKQIGVGVRILTSKTISDYFKTKDAISKVMTKNFKWKPFSEFKQIKIYRSSKYQNLYKTQNLLNCSFSQALEKVQLVRRVPTHKLLHYQKIENFSNAISASYYKYVVKGCTHQMLCIVEQINKQDYSKIIYKSIDNFVVEKNVDFIQIKIQRISHDKTKIGAYGFVNFAQSKALNSVSVTDFFLSIVECQTYDEPTLKKLSTSKPQFSFQIQSTIIHQQHPHDYTNDDDQFRTVAGDNFDSDQEKQLQICNTFQSPKKQFCDELQDLDGQTKQERNVIDEFRFQKNQTIANSRRYSLKLCDIVNQSDYLRKKHIVIPPHSNGQKKLIKEHFFIGEWGVYQTGGVYSLNTKMINKQKKIFQSILTRLGKALMSKKLSNISIPVVALGKQSFLQSIARNMCYGPLLLQRLQNKTPLQKMKKSVVFMISMGTIGLAYAKPFNPILGETFQAFIDHCPVYMEQTCHHPPISTLYFKGRGYDVFGSVHPSMSLRINSVKGYSDASFYIKYQNKDLTQFRPAKMQIGGLLVGERTFDFVETSYVFDEKNKLITEITFGPKKKFGKYNKGDKTDFFWGYIYEVSENFMMKFKAQGKILSPDHDKSSSKMAQIYGCWHQKIYIDQKLVYDFQTQLPCEIIYEKYTLRSDSRLRLDISYLNQQKFTEAQDEKDRLQQIQRQDAKMRKASK